MLQSRLVCNLPPVTILIISPLIKLRVTDPQRLKYYMERLFPTTVKVPLRFQMPPINCRVAGMPRPHIPPEVGTLVKGQSRLVCNLPPVTILIINPLIKLWVTDPQRLKRLNSKFRTFPVLFRTVPYSGIDRVCQFLSIFAKVTKIYR